VEAVEALHNFIEFNCIGKVYGFLPQPPLFGKGMQWWRNYSD
jgi:hypothetical protein